MHKRIYFAFFGMIIIFGILISNLGVIIINTQHSSVSKNRSVKSNILASSRGMIYDTNMEKIVNNNESILTICLPTTDALNEIKTFVSKDELSKLYENMSERKISVLSLPKKFYEKHIKSVTVTNRYLDEQPCVHLIGHLDENGDGVTGLEKAYNSYLSGHQGDLKAIWNTDALGNILLGEGIKFESNGYLSPAGIQLTIDLDIQEIAEKALLTHNIDKGAVVILNSFTNEILAMASVPTFNPDNISADIQNPDSPFINRAITPYSVGSVFKPFVASCALENNILLTHECSGRIEIGKTEFRCNNSISHGSVDMNSAMEQSCNTYFIALGQEIGKEKLLFLCSDFGLGKQIEIADNFLQKSGNLPSVDSINSPQTLANFSFGQGELLASPLQMAVAYSCFANGGYYREPTLMKGIIDENSNVIQKVQLPQSYRILNASTVKEINRILKNVVSVGTGKKAYSDTTINYGKTATAQSGWYENGREITHTWFCGYFSANDTTYTVVVFKDDGKSGSIDCAPVFKDISEEISGIKSKKMNKNN